MILWPLVIQQKGFPEKQDIQGEPDKLNHMEKEKKRVKSKYYPMNGNLKYIGRTQYTIEVQWNLN